MSTAIAAARRRVFLSLVALVFGAIAGCTTPASVEAPALATASPTGDYLIGPGDTLEIFVWREPELSVTVRVRPDGRISTRLVDDLEAAGKTPTQLAADIETVLAEYIRSPEVNVIVQGFVGTFGSQVRVVGEAVQPQSIAYRDRMTLLDVAIEAGGLTEFAAGNRSRVVRSNDGRSTEMRVRLQDLLNGEIEHNILMQPGDVVIIPAAVF